MLNRVKLNFLCAFFFAGLLCSAGFLSCRTIGTVTYKLESPKLIPSSSIRVAHVSDLHSTIFGRDQSPLINKIKSVCPDVIVLTGDIVDDVVSVKGAELFFEGLRGGVPVYYVTGNHEFNSGRINSIREFIKSYGIIILSSSYSIIDIRGNILVIAGVDDPYKKRFEDPEYSQAQSMKAAFSRLNDMGGYKILLAHRPEFIKEYSKYPFDLILSGHYHGGQVRLPFVNGLYVPNQGLFPRYAGGLYRHGALVHVISRGLCVNWIPRIFNPPELDIIDILSM